MTNKKIYTGFDLIKLFAAVGIIAIHTRVPFLNIIGRLGVPFFAIVSSVLFFNHYQYLNNDEMKRNYLIKFCKRIFLLYAVWQVIYIPIAIHQFRTIMLSLNGINFQNILRYGCDFIFPAVYNSRGVDLTQDANGWGPSWYLLASIVAMPVFVLLLKLVRHRILPIFLLCLLPEIYIILADEFGNITHWQPFINHTFLRLLIYFCIGYLIVVGRKHLEAWSLTRLVCAFVVFLLLFIIENLLVHFYGGTYDTEEVITTAPTGFLLSVIAMRINPVLRHPVQVRNLSTFLYCFQIWPIIIFQQIFKIFGWQTYHLVLFMLVMLVSLLAAFLYDLCRQHYRWNFLKYMV